MKFIERLLRKLESNPEITLRVVSVVMFALSVAAIVTSEPNNEVAFLLGVLNGAIAVLLWTDTGFEDDDEE